MSKYKYKRFLKKKGKKDIILSILKSRFFWLILLIFVSIGIILYFVIFSSFFQIKEINVSGTKKIASVDIKNIISKDITNKIFWFDSKNIFLVNFRRAREDIMKKFPDISEVKFQKKFFNKIFVTISKRIPIAVFCQEENCFYIDNNGVIFKKAIKGNKLMKIRENNKRNKKLEIGDITIKKELMSKILKIKNGIESNNLKINLDSTLIVSNERINIETKEKWEIYFNLQKNLDWQITELSSVLKEIPYSNRKKLKYIDLRFNKVYIFPSVLLSK